MGLIRVYLAVAVVFAHMGMNWPGVHGLMAVVFFFAISGFYMALILNEKYDRAAPFYLARYLRLWPSFAVVLALTCLFLQPLPRTPDWAFQTYVWFTGVSILGYETTNWVVLPTPEATFSLVPNTEQSFGGMMNMRHMWSIGIEIVFYVIAPLFARRPRLLVAAFIAAYAGHVWIHYNLIPHHPIRYRSALGYLWLFFAGMLAYWCWRLIRNRIAFERIPYWVAAPGAALFSWVCLYYAAWNGRWTTNPVFSDALVLVFALMLGPIFQATRSNKWDRNVGELSYAIYLVHWPIVVGYFRPYFYDWRFALLAAAISIVAAAALYLLVERPVDRFRQRLAVSPRLAAVQVSVIP